VRNICREMRTKNEPHFSAVTVRVDSDALM